MPYSCILMLVMIETYTFSELKGPPTCVTFGCGSNVPELFVSGRNYCYWCTFVIVSVKLLSNVRDRVLCRSHVTHRGFSFCSEKVPSPITFCCCTCSCLLLLPPHRMITFWALAISFDQIHFILNFSVLPADGCVLLLVLPLSGLLTYQS